MEFHCVTSRTLNLEQNSRAKMEKCILFKLSRLELSMKIRKVNSYKRSSQLETALWKTVSLWVESCSMTVVALSLLHAIVLIIYGKISTIQAKTSPPLHLQSPAQSEEVEPDVLV